MNFLISRNICIYDYSNGVYSTKLSPYERSKTMGWVEKQAPIIIVSKDRKWA